MKVYSDLAANTREVSLKFSDFFLVTAAGLVSAVSLYFGTGLHPIWWLLWLAPVPVLAIAPRLHSGAAFLLGFVAWLIGEMNQWNYVRNQLELPPQITLLYFLVPAVVFGLAVLFMRSFLRRGCVFLAALAFPLYWVAYEPERVIGPCSSSCWFFHFLRDQQVHSNQLRLARAACGFPRTVRLKQCEGI